MSDTTTNREPPGRTTLLAGAAETDGSTLRHFPQVRPIADVRELEALAAAAKADDHDVLFPTHIARKDGEIVGYASIGALALVNVWAHSQRLRARESLTLLNLVENVAHALGQRTVCMPCAEQSPFRPLLPGLGYKNLGSASFHVKGI